MDGVLFGQGGLELLDGAGLIREKTRARSDSGALRASVLRHRCRSPKSNGYTMPSGRGRAIVKTRKSASSFTLTAEPRGVSITTWRERSADQGGSFSRFAIAHLDPRDLPRSPFFP